MRKSINVIKKHIHGLKKRTITWASQQMQEKHLTVFNNISGCKGPEGPEGNHPSMGKAIPAKPQSTAYSIVGKWTPYLPVKNQTRRGTFLNFIQNSTRHPKQKNEKPGISLSDTYIPCMCKALVLIPTWEIDEIILTLFQRNWKNLTLTRENRILPGSINHTSWFQK